MLVTTTFRLCMYICIYVYMYIQGEIDCEFILRQCRLFGKRRASVYALLLMDCCYPHTSSENSCHCYSYLL
jgi:hypothetical protein